MASHATRDSAPPTFRSPKYSQFQNDIYRDGFLYQKKPVVTTDPNKLEEQARGAIPLEAFNYAAGGAGSKSTMDANLASFKQWKLVPRMLRGTSQRDLRVELFGTTYDTPVLMAPVGVQGIFHKDKETGLAEVCAELGVPYILSTAATSSIEEVAAASGNGPRWFQLYWPGTNAITQSLLQRAKASGYKVLVVTLDAWSLSWRPADLDEAYLPFVKGVGVQVGLSDPVFREIFEKQTGKKVEDDLHGASAEWIKDVFSGLSYTWDHIALLRESWDGPIVLKGIQHPDDAKLALKYGCQGIVVSNHGGRQYDGSVGALEMLPEIVEAVGGKMAILFDSGIRTGVDIIKALCLGADAVLVARPVIYGLAINGKEGAKQVLQGLLADFDQSMALTGIGSIKECNKSMLRM